VSALENALDKLDGVKQSGESWMARCPAHDDRTPSLSIKQGDRASGVVLNCFAGCSVQDVAAAIGMTVADLFDDKPEPQRTERRIAATYPYSDEQGTLLYEVVRYDPKDFRQRRPDGRGGWVWNLQGTRRVPYQLPALIAADTDATVYVPEGERDVDAIRAAGGVATCNPQGAGKWGTVAEVARHVLAGRDVVIVPDQDKAGDQHARQVAESLVDVARTLTIARPAVGNDAAEHLGAGRTLAELVVIATSRLGDLSDTIEEWLAVAPCDEVDEVAEVDDDQGDADGDARPVFHDLPAEYRPQPLEWLVRGLIPRETHGEIGGAQKTLKSYIATTIAVGVALGRPVLGEFEVPERRRALLIAGEGGERMLLARLHRICRAYGAPWSDLVGWLRYTTVSAPITSPVFAQHIAAEVESFDPGLVNLDPWYVYGGADANASQLGEIGERLETVRRTAGQGRALFINHHLNQTGTGTGIVKLSGAGHAEWVDSWLLLGHRTPPNVDAGQFRLSLDVGSRQWGGASHDVDYNIGRFDTEHGAHDGDISWTVTARGRADGTEDVIEARIAAAKERVVKAWKQRRVKAKSPWTATEWIENAGGTKSDNRTAFHRLVDEGRIACASGDPDTRGAKWALNEGQYGL
jgi:hypothetical protein